jgi:DNA-directed RNA polymerase subunit alpha
MLESTFQPVEEATEDRKQITPGIEIVETSGTYGKLAIEPLERGFATTLANPLRRVLLNSISGTAITWIRIDDILHEYSSISGVKEDVMDILLNVKALRIRSVTGRPGKMRLEVKGEGEVCAGDIATSADFEIINPELHLVSLSSPDAVLSMELNVEQGKGYQPATETDGLPQGVLPVDAIFSPVWRVNYNVEQTRVGQQTNYERLVLEIWTDGTIAPVEAAKQAAQILIDNFFLVARADEEDKPGPTPFKPIPPDIYQISIDRLELSPRTLNCLKRAHITKVGEVLEKNEEELMKIRNFGDKSLRELRAALEAQDLLQEATDTGAGQSEEGEVNGEETIE